MSNVDTADQVTTATKKQSLITEDVSFDKAPYPLRAAFFDIDGTLLDQHHKVSPRTREAIATLKRQGIVVGLATGRGSFASRDIARDLGVLGPSMFFAGSLIEDISSGEVLYRVELSSTAVGSLIQLCSREKYHLEFYTESDFYAERVCEQLLIHQQYSVRPAVVAPLVDIAAQKSLIKSVIMTTVGAGEEKLRRELSQIPEITTTYSYGAAHPDIVFANIVDSRATRTAAFKKLLEIVGCAAHEVATFGDADADSEFLSLARFGVAMANASSAAKQAASFITTRVDEGGVGLAIERLFL